MNIGVSTQPPLHLSASTEKYNPALVPASTGGLPNVVVLVCSTADVREAKTTDHIFSKDNRLRLMTALGIDEQCGACGYVGCCKNVRRPDADLLPGFTVYVASALLIKTI